MKLLYAQSGGVTAVINATAAGVFASARRKSFISGYYAGINGILGVLNEDLVDIQPEEPQDIELLRYQPGGAFGSCRFKLPQPDGEGASVYEKLLDIIKKHQIDYLLYNGGGDSADTCLKIAQFAEDQNYPLKTLHLPKTIDNDLPHTHFSPGFGSVARFTALSVLETAMDLASMSSTSTKVFILEVMGRHTGWIAAAAAMAQRSGCALPLIIIFPEVPFDKQRFLTLLEEKVKTYGHCSVVASEGARDTNGNFLSSTGASFDAFGHKQLGGSADVIGALIKDQLKLKFHRAISDYIQRAAAHAASRIDRHIAYEIGRKAVCLMEEGVSKAMISVRYDEDNQWHFEPVDLNQVANVEKALPHSFIDESRFGVTQKCRDYLLPFMAKDTTPLPLDSDGLPRYAKLKMIRIRKGAGESVAPILP